MGGVHHCLGADTMTAALDAILKLAEQLDPAEQDMLIDRLQSARTEFSAPMPTDYKSLAERLGNMRLNLNPTREDLLAELAIVRRLPVNPNGGLLGKHAESVVPIPDADDLHADLQAIATEWEQELDEFYVDKP
jgi:hypothetical protein